MTIVVSNLGAVAPAATNSASLTVAAAIPAGTLVLVAINDGVAGSGGTIAIVASNFSDSAGNRYQVLPGTSNAGIGAPLSIGWSIIANTLVIGATITYTSVGNIPSFNTIIAMAGIAVGGTVPGYPFDVGVAAAAAGMTGAGQPVSVTSGKPAFANELFVAVASNGNALAFSPDLADGWGNQQQAGQQVGITNGKQIQTSYQIVSTPAPVTFATPDNVGNWAALIVGVVPLPPQPSPTGPPFPPLLPGIGAIGQFQIGVSPIGTIPPFNVWNTIITQYSNSPILDAIITAFESAMELTGLTDLFFDLVYNVATAQGEGLDVWGRIVGVNRTVLLPTSTQYLGFQEGGSWVGFNQAPFYAGGQITQNFTLLDSDFRTLVYAKALANISNGSIESVNNILLTLFPGQGAAYVLDNGGMSVTYAFDFQLTQTQVAMLGQSGVLPTATGVSANLLQVPSWLLPFKLGGVAGAGLPLIFADFTTTNEFYYKGTLYASYSAWKAGTGLVFTRASAGYYTNASGLLASAATNVERFDYDPIALTLRGLLMEQASTNLFLQSLFASSWSTANTTLTPNAAAGPDGTTTAAFVHEDNTNNQHNVTQDITVTSGHTYTLSVYAKQGTRRYIWLTYFGEDYVYFDLQNGVISANASNYPATITPAPNGFYRCTASLPTGTTDGHFFYGLSQTGLAGSITYTGDGASGAYFWGAQVELLPFATSYIATTTAAATRAFDNFAGLAVPASPVATMYVRANLTYPQGDGTNNQLLMSFNSAGGNNRDNLFVSTVSPAQMAFETIINNIHVADIGGITPAISANVPFSVAGSWNPGAYSVSLNGGAPFTNATTAAGSYNTNLELAALSGGDTPNGRIIRLAFWEFPATSTQVQSLAAL